MQAEQQYLLPIDAICLRLKYKQVPIKVVGVALHSVFSIMHLCIMMITTTVRTLHYARGMCVIVSGIICLNPWDEFPV